MPEYFQQVTAEKLVTRKKDFHTIMEWVKVGERNEALDCFVYARAAVAIRRPNFRKIYREMFRQSEALRKQREAAGTPAPTPAEETIGPAAPPLPPPPKPPALPASTAPRRRRPNIAAQLRNRLR
jgi:phage terminase large subunit GpA-like protein